MPTTQTPILGDELARRANERRKFLAEQKTEGAAFREALAIACAAHGAQSGQPCWKLGDSSRGICASRVSRAIGLGQLERMKEKAERDKQKAIMAEGRRRKQEAAS